ncbi:MAG TPA: TonB-dependent receptor [Gemmatimonadaceae bacterium]|nr:TonB-dependent receptor [Gemmatimonadaceae bacterium]
MNYSSYSNYFHRFARDSAICIALLTASQATARAQSTSNDTTTLQRVVVTATRLPSAAGAATLSTTVVSGDDLRARGVSSVLEALRETPSVGIVQGGSFGQQTSLFLRGGQSNYTQVLVDGVVVNDPGGAIDLANLTTDNIDRIEIVRGPASVLYGANAVTGVIQIFTRKGAGPLRVDAWARGGTYGTREGEVSTRGGDEKVGYSLSAAQHNTDGIYRVNSAARNGTYSGGLRVTPDKRSDIALNLRYIDAGAHIATNSNGVPNDSNQTHTERRLIGSLDAGRFLTSRLEARVSLAATDADARSEDRPDSPNDTDFPYDIRTRLYRRSADARLNFSLAPNVVASGGGSYETQHHRASGSGAQQRDVSAGYAQIAGTSFETLSYTGGIRLDHNSTFGNFTSYRAGAAYELPGDVRVHAAIGSAFREPTFEESSSTQPFDVGNPDLRPERSRSWEAGAERELVRGRASIGATYFNQRFRDMIQYNGLVAPGAANYYNLAAATSDGVEVTLRMSPVTALTISASYTYARTRVTNAGIDSAATASFVQGERLLRRPANLASATASYAFRRPETSLHLEVAAVGDRDDRDFSDDVTFVPKAVTLPSYTVVALAGELGILRRSASASPELVLTARVENLFDRSYQQIFGFASPRRTILVGARIGVAR